MIKNNKAIAVLFDFNGTMFFDEKFQEQSWKMFIHQKTGKEVSEKDFQSYIHGRNADFTLPYFLNRSLSREEIEMLEEEKEQLYRRLCLQSDEFRLADGLEAFLDKLKFKSIPVTIATASGLNNVKFFFEHLNLGKWFDIEQVVYNNGQIAGKPEPDFYLKASEALGVDIHECIVFEDSLSGIESARRANAGKIVRVASMAVSMSAGNDVFAVIQDYTDLKLLSEILGTDL